MAAFEVEICSGVCNNAPVEWTSCKMDDNPSGPPILHHCCPAMQRRLVLRVVWASKCVLGCGDCHLKQSFCPNSLQICFQKETKSRRKNGIEDLSSGGLGRKISRELGRVPISELTHEEPPPLPKKKWGQWFPNQNIYQPGQVWRINRNVSVTRALTQRTEVVEVLFVPGNKVSGVETWSG